MQKLIFETSAQAEAALAAINVNMKAALLADGGTEDENGYIVPTNAATGQPDMAAARTTTWDEVREEEDGTFTLTMPEDMRLLEGVE